MSDIVVWVEPDEDGTTPAWKALPVAKAAAFARKSAEGKHVYATDDEALDDFIVVHWAQRYALTSERDALKAALATIQAPDKVVVPKEKLERWVRAALDNKTRLMVSEIREILSPLQER